MVDPDKHAEIRLLHCNEYTVGVCVCVFSYLILIRCLTTIDEVIHVDRETDS